MVSTPSKPATNALPRSGDKRRRVDVFGNELVFHRRIDVGLNVVRIERRRERFARNLRNDFRQRAGEARDERDRFGMMRVQVGRRLPPSLARNASRRRGSSAANVLRREIRGQQKALRDRLRRPAEHARLLRRHRLREIRIRQRDRVDAARSSAINPACGGSSRNFIVLESPPFASTHAIVASCSEPRTLCTATVLPLSSRALRSGESARTIVPVTGEATL